VKVAIVHLKVYARLIQEYELWVASHGIIHTKFHQCPSSRSLLETCRWTQPKSYEKNA